MHNGLSPPLPLPPHSLMLSLCACVRACEKMWHTVTVSFGPSISFGDRRESLFSMFSFNLYTGYLETSGFIIVHPLLVLNHFSLTINSQLQM
jgi:hypothetical protein